MVNNSNDDDDGINETKWFSYEKKLHTGWPGFCFFFFFLFSFFFFLFSFFFFPFFPFSLFFLFYFS